MSRIYLIGFMGVGKSTLGRKLASQLNYKSFDLDDAFEEKYKINVAQFFRKYDETLFRKLELNLLETTFTMENVVISTGGGTPCFFDSIDRMNQAGITIYLQMPPKALAVRLQNARKPRPLVINKSKDALLAFIIKTLEERNAYYQKAHLKINAIDVDLKDLEIQINKLRMNGV